MNNIIKLFEQLKKNVTSNMSSFLSKIKAKLSNVKNKCPSKKVLIFIFNNNIQNYLINYLIYTLLSIDLI